MDSRRHQMIKSLFEGARHHRGAERDDFLAARCPGDDETRREVESLLALYDDDSEFLCEPPIGHEFRLKDLERAASGDIADDFAAAGDEPAALPDHIGHCEILGLLGEGGMGVVYEARQENPRRRVAIKVIRTGLAPSLLRRFGHEAQTLARLRHPGIAQIYEAGTFGRGRAAQPFFAMELVNGPALTEYCDARRLGARDRLALLARLCDAVHHAHQQGVVHRDLKPGNILVDETGQPKILDFGVARVTDSDVQATTVGTHVGQILGTVPYMSPEQVAGDPAAVDTRTDVYALGVIGYELLAGRLPLDVHRKTIAEAARIIRDAEPNRLGTVDRTCRGDIETIVATALAKDKDLRYPSAAALAADIRRHLADEPIVARTASTFYQLRKFTKRNRPLVAVLSLAFVALLAATIVSGVFWQRAERRGAALSLALTSAELEASKATAINEFLTGMLRSVDPRRRAREVTVLEVLDEAALTIDDAFDEQPLVRADVRQAIASSYGSLGAYGAALDHARAAVALHTEHLGPDDPGTLRSLTLLAGVLERLGRYDEAEPIFTQVQSLRERRLGAEHPDTLLAGSNLALLYYMQGRRAEARELWTETLEACRRSLGPEHPTTLVVMTKLGWLYHDEGRSDEAESLYVPALELSRQVLGAEHPETLTVTTCLGRLRHDQGRHAEAETLLLQSLEAQTRTMGEEHAETLRTMQNLGWLYTDLGRYEDAEPLHEEELRICREVFGEMHPATAYAMSALAVCCEAQGRFDESETLKIAALGIRREVVGDEHPTTLISLNDLASLYFARGRYAEAEPLWKEALEVQRRVLGPEHPDTLDTMASLERLHFELKRDDAARSEHAVVQRAGEPADDRRRER